MELRPFGSLLLGAGLVLVILGLILLYAPGIFSKLGHLPGDLRWEREGVRIYFPLTTMLLLSLLLTLILNLIFRGKG